MKEGALTSRSSTAGGLRYLLATICLVIGFASVTVLYPLVGAVAALAGFFIWTFAWKQKAFFTAHFALAVGAVICVPFLRLTESSGTLKVAVPALLVLTTLAVVVRVRGCIPKKFALTAAIFLLLEALATVVVEDLNEWLILVVLTAVTFAGVVFAGAAARLDAWPIVARVLILMVAMEAALSLCEVFDLVSGPIWRGGKVLPDGNSVYQRNEIISSWPRAQGTFAHALPLSLMLVIGAVLVIRTPMRRTGAKPFLFMLMAAGLLASGSRNSIVLFLVLTALAYALPSLVLRLQSAIALAVIAVICAFPFLLEKYAELVESGSVTHRLGAIEAVPNLMSRPLLMMLFGDGAASAPRLYASGMLQTDGLAAVDNQYVLTLAENGLVGLGLLIAVIWVAALRGSATLRILILAVAVSGMIFDLLAWPSSAFFLWFLAGCAFSRVRGTDPVAVADTPQLSGPKSSTSGPSGNGIPKPGVELVQRFRQPVRAEHNRHSRVH